jgi:hypothetical protein
MMFCPFYKFARPFSGPPPVSRGNPPLNHRNIHQHSRHNQLSYRYPYSANRQTFFRLSQLFLTKAAIPPRAEKTCCPAIKFSNDFEYFPQLQTTMVTRVRFPSPAPLIINDLGVSASEVQVNHSRHFLSLRFMTRKPPLSVRSIWSDHPAGRFGLLVQTVEAR